LKKREKFQNYKQSNYSSLRLFPATFSKTIKISSLRLISRVMCRGRHAGLPLHITPLRSSSPISLAEYPASASTLRVSSPKRGTCPGVSPNPRTNPVHAPASHSHPTTVPSSSPFAPIPPTPPESAAPRSSRLRDPPQESAAAPAHSLARHSIYPTTLQCPIALMPYSNLNSFSNCSPVFCLLPSAYCNLLPLLPKPAQLPRHHQDRTRRALQQRQSQIRSHARRSSLQMLADHKQVILPFAHFFQNFFHYHALPSFHFRLNSLIQQRQRAFFQMTRNPRRLRSRRCARRRVNIQQRRRRAGAPRNPSPKNNIALARFPARRTKQDSSNRRRFILDHQCWKARPSD